MGTVGQGGNFDQQGFGRDLREIGTITGGESWWEEGKNLGCSKLPLFLRAWAKGQKKRVLGFGCGQYGFMYELLELSWAWLNII